MRRAALALALLVPLVLPATPTVGQTPSTFRQEILGQFNNSARKLVALARAMPTESYAWAPSEGVASVARAYMHIARYNYMYPAENLGAPAPAGVDYGSFEEGERGKEEVVATLEASMDHVRAVVDRMSDEDLNAMTTLYGRDVGKWAVLLQLVAHMNEHLGQEIAYARMNGVVPPWSR